MYTKLWWNLNENTQKPFSWIFWYYNTKHRPWKVTWGTKSAICLSVSSVWTRTTTRPLGKQTSTMHRDKLTCRTHISYCNASLTTLVPYFSLIGRKVITEQTQRVGILFTSPWCVCKQRCSIHARHQHYEQHSSTQNHEFAKHWHISVAAALALQKHMQMGTKK